MSLFLTPPENYRAESPETWSINADGYTQEGTKSLCRVCRSAEMAHTERLSFDRPHSGRPPSHTIYVYARAGFVHTSPQHNWSAYVVPRAGSLICKSKVHTPVLQYSSFNKYCKRTRTMYLFSRCRYVLFPAAQRIERCQS